MTISSLIAPGLAEVSAALNQIIDPCSGATGTGIGLVDMGIVRDVTVVDGSVEVTIKPTFVGCLFVGIFETEIRARVDALPGVNSVSVNILEADGDWDESHIAPGARRRLELARAHRPTGGAA